MTATELMRKAATLGITLEARGDRLHVEARPHVLTPELRDQLAQHKAEILERLAPTTEFIYLKGGLTVPRQALERALDLERRGFRQSVDEQQRYQIQPTTVSGPLTHQDRAGIARWRHHLGAIVAYECPEVA